MEELVLLTSEFFEAHPELAQPYQPFSPGDIFLYFNDIGFFLQQHYSSMNSELEKRYRVAFTKLTHAIISGEFPPISANEVGSAIAYRIIMMSIKEEGSHE